jgi:hypothetical protein
MTSDQVIEKMKQGYELRNYGKGYFLFPRPIPYKHQESIPVDDELVREMEKQKLIVVSMPYRSLIATLVNEH